MAEVPVSYRPVIRPLPSRWPRHLLLFAATLLTVSLAGGTWATGEFPRLNVASFREHVALGWGYGVMALAVLGAHELGHYLACRHWGVPASLPFFLPGVPPLGTFGALIRIYGRIPHRRALFDIAVAGPIAGFLVALPIAVLGLALGDKLPPGEVPTGGLGRPVLFHLIDRLLFGETLYQRTNVFFGAAWVGMLVTSLNLFPVGQLDGGHTAYALSRRLHRAVSWLTIAALTGWIVYTTLHGSLPPYLLWLGFLVWMRDRHPPLVEEHSPLGRGRVAVALLVLVLFALSFIPTPLR